MRIENEKKRQIHKKQQKQQFLLDFPENKMCRVKKITQCFSLSK
jgi:hypothetical protein